MKAYKYYLLITFILVAFVSTGQKLPNVQPSGIRAPKNIKIDGKADEYGNKFMAYNKAVELFYTISNDDDNLYLIVRATKPRIIEKLINVGVTFTVNSAGKKNEKAEENATIKFPNIDPAHASAIVMNAGAKEASKLKAPVLNGVVVDSTDLKIIKSNDSLKKVANQMLVENAKDIKIKGIKEIPESDISVYNEQKIYVSQRFDGDAAYTYELSIPLKYLGLALKEEKTFSYHLQLESRLNAPKRGMVVRYIYPNGIPTNIDQDFDSTTDFWGELTLARK